MFNNEIYNILVEYIEQNKTNNNIEYQETIDCLKDLVKDIEKDYKNLEGEE